MLEPIVSGAVGTVTLVAGSLIALVFVLLAVGSGSVVVEPNGWLLLRHVLRADGGVALEIGGTTLLGIGVGGGIAWATASRLVGRGSKAPKP